MLCNQDMVRCQCQVLVLPELPRFASGVLLLWSAGPKSAEMPTL